MTKLKVLIVFLFFSHLAFSMQNNEVGFHFYGANDCPPCMKFKKNYLQKVMLEGKEYGFSVSENIIDETSDVDSVGVYGVNDALLRKAGEQLPFVYPPIFFVTDKKNNVVSAYLGDWESALEDSINLSIKGSNE